MKSLLIIFSLISIGSFAQEHYNRRDSSEVRGVIDRLFAGMRNGDSAMVASTFHSDIQLITSHSDAQGKPDMAKGSATTFLHAVGRPHEEVWDERISHVELRIDDNLAQAWMNYSFYVGGKFSHCGVNAIHLIRTDSGWKIIQLADTRRNGDCKTEEY
jgi:hypothetical protein